MTKSTTAGRKKNNGETMATQGPRRSARLCGGVGGSSHEREHKLQQLDNNGKRQRPGGGQREHRRHADGDLVVGGNAGGDVLSDKSDRDIGRSHNGSDGQPKTEVEIKRHPYQYFNISRLCELLHASNPKWHIREIDEVLLDEDWGDGVYPRYRDIETVGDILRIGSAALSMRFREVDPGIWVWLLNELEDLKK